MRRRIRGELGIHDRVGSRAIWRRYCEWWTSGVLDHGEKDRGGRPARWFFRGEPPVIEEYNRQQKVVMAVIRAEPGHRRVTVGPSRDLVRA